MVKKSIFLLSFLYLFHLTISSREPASKSEFFQKTKDIFDNEKKVVQCKALDDKFEVGWLFLNETTLGVQYSLEVEPGTWFAFGKSGSNSSSMMMGAFVYILFLPINGTAEIVAYNITGRLPCGIPGFPASMGSVCPSDVQDATLLYNDTLTATDLLEDGNVTVQFAVPIFNDGGNLPAEPTAIVWASGTLRNADNSATSLSVHDKTIKENLWVDFSAAPTGDWDCKKINKASVPDGLYPIDTLPMPSQADANSSSDFVNITAKYVIVNNVIVAYSETFREELTNNSQVAPTASSPPPMDIGSKVGQCRQLAHGRHEVGWTIVNDIIYIQYQLTMKLGQWFAFGWAGESNSTNMLGGEVFIFFAPRLDDPQTADHVVPPKVRAYKISGIHLCNYNITDLGDDKIYSGEGVCESLDQNLTLLHTDTTESGHVIARFSRPLDTANKQSHQFSRGPTPIIWAKGALRDDRNTPHSLMLHSEIVLDTTNIDFFNFNKSLWNCHLMKRIESEEPKEISTEKTTSISISHQTTQSLQNFTEISNVSVETSNETEVVNSTGKTVLSTGCLDLVASKYQVSWKIFADDFHEITYDLHLNGGNWFGFGWNSYLESRPNGTNKPANDEFFVVTRPKNPAIQPSVRHFNLDGACYFSALTTACDEPRVSTLSSIQLLAVNDSKFTVTFLVNSSDVRTESGFVSGFWGKGVFDEELDLLRKHDEHNNVPIFVDFFQNSTECVNVGQNYFLELFSQIYKDPGRVKRQTSSLGWRDIPMVNDRLQLIFTLGPTGGDIRGYSAIRRLPAPSSGTVLYVNGLLSPDVNVTRFTTYYIFPLTGDEHPIYITADPVGGFFQQSRLERVAYRNYAGINRFGGASIKGVYCAYHTNITQSKINELPAYAEFFKTLTLSCGPTFNNRALASYHTWTPDDQTPNTVYYQSMGTGYMGGRIIVSN